MSTAAEDRAVNAYLAKQFRLSLFTVTTEDQQEEGIEAIENAAYRVCLAPTVIDQVANLINDELRAQKSAFRCHVNMDADD